MTARHSCAECVRTLPWYAAGRVTADERALVEAHLAGCARCRDELAQWRAVGVALAREEAQTAPERTSAEEWMRLSERIQALDLQRAILGQERDLVGLQRGQEAIAEQSARLEPERQGG